MFGIGRFRYDRMANMADITDHIEVMERHEKEQKLIEDGDRMQKLSQDADKMMEETSPPDKTLEDYAEVIESFKKIFTN